MKPPKFQISCQKIRETTQKKKSIKQEPKKKVRGGIGKTANEFATEL